MSSQASIAPAIFGVGARLITDRGDGDRYMWQFSCRLLVACAFGFHVSFIAPHVIAVEDKARSEALGQFHFPEIDSFLLHQSFSWVTDNSLSTQIKHSQAMKITVRMHISKCHPRHVSSVESLQY